jgi:hypothetical protein
MNDTVYQQVSVYINEGDEWKHRPLHLEILTMLYKEGMAGGTVVRGIAGFTGAEGVHSTSLVDAGGKLPLVVHFIDTVQNIQRVLPLLREMTRHRLITVQPVEIIS